VKLFKVPHLPHLISKLVKMAIASFRWQLAHLISINSVCMDRPYDDPA
jgi:hypothetical protein